uniref:Uncharacterized protein n=1 Tax=Rhipicephalus zambeziensis TaxID=60191 RepID=A0A224YH42_9ACAR
MTTIVRYSIERLAQQELPATTRSDRPIASNKAGLLSPSTQEHALAIAVPSTRHALQLFFCLLLLAQLKHLTLHSYTYLWLGLRLAVLRRFGSTSE